MHVSVDVHAQPLVRPFQVSCMTTATVDVLTLRLTADDGEVEGLGEISAEAGHGQDGAAIADEARGLATVLAADPASLDPAHLEARLGEAAGTVSAPLAAATEQHPLTHRRICQIRITSCQECDTSGNVVIAGRTA